MNQLEFLTAARAALDGQGGILQALLLDTTKPGSVAEIGAVTAPNLVVGYLEVDDSELGEVDPVEGREGVGSFPAERLAVLLDRRIEALKGIEYSSNQPGAGEPTF